MTVNLNELRIPVAQGEGKILENFSVSSGTVEVIFRDLEKKLISEIKSYDLVFGCVAWLTSTNILEALAHCMTSIVVQKEDFLRPDVPQSKDYLRSLYAALDCSSIQKFSLPGIGPELSYLGSPEIEPIRCVGNHNRDRKPAHPRMHNKFAVFCRYIERTQVIVPQKVWTGSFNFSANASDSFENAVLISDMDIATAYLNEFVQIYALSEPLNWENDWCSPTLRIGS